MRRLYSAASLTDAYLLLHRLQHAGIAAHVLNAHAGGGLGDIPFTHVWPEVWIEQDGEFERAHVVISQYESANANGPIRWCDVCGEENPPTFEYCWNCNTVLIKE